MSRSSKVKAAGVIGYPLKHSLSPVFQQAAFDFYGLPVRYEAWETPLEKLAGLIHELRDGSRLGANVTTPHKQAVMPLLDGLDDGALQIGAVNTIANRDGRLVGFNTDADGFARSLDEAGYTGADKATVVLGTGGAARAVGVSLLRMGAKRITYVTRDGARAQLLVDDLARLDTGCALAYCSYDRSCLEATIADCDLIVNATVVGMRHGPAANRSPLPDDLVPPGVVVLDLVYNPPVTKLLVEAEARGATTINGASMLVYQGAASFELWTGKQAPVGLMFERLLEALEKL